MRSDGARRGFTAAELASACGGELHGGGELEILGIRSLEKAGPSDLSFVADRKAVRKAQESNAGLLIVRAGEGSWNRPVIEVPDPSLALIPLLHLFRPRRRPRPGIHETAVVPPTARVDATAEIGPYAVLGEHTVVGGGCLIEAHCVLGDSVRLGDGVWLHPHVVLYDEVVVGPGSEIHSGAVLGADGFGYATAKTGIRKIPQIGRVELGSDVEIGANSCVDRASLEVTRIGDNTKIDDLVMIGHNCELGRSNFVCGQVGLAGSTATGDGVILAGQVGAAGHLRIGNGAKVGAQTGVNTDVPDGQEVFGTPMMPFRETMRVIAETRRLPETARLVRDLAKRVSRLEEPRGE